MLVNFVSLYVPGTYGLSDNIPPELQLEIARETAQKLSAAFGGSTSINATGYYVADNGDLIEENIIILKSFHDQDPAAAVAIASKIGAWIKKQLLQESVSLESETGLTFI